MNLHLIKPTVHVVDRKSKNNVVGISIISRCPSLSRCLVLPHPSGCKKKRICLFCGWLEVFLFASGINGTKLAKKIKVFSLLGTQL